MSLACPSCGTALPDGAKFCLECGARLEPGAAAVPTRPPVPALERRERRVLTVLFADLAGFTAASDGADVEDVHARVRPWQDLVRRVVADERGTVARVVGDGLMVVWGYPVAREDDALRAVRAGLRILDALPGAGADLHARIGVNTGEALVTFGSALEDADDAMGDAVNIAARFQGAAALDTLVLGEDTARLVEASVDLEPLEPLHLKGKATPVAAYRAVSLRGSTGTAAAHLPLIGREAELEALRGDLAAAQIRVVRRLVTGEPGIGKSRLLAELRRDAQAADPSLRWYIGRCRDGQRAPGLALGEVLKAWAGISDQDGPEAVRTRMNAAVAENVPDRAWLLDRLAPLVGLASGSPSEPEERRAAWLRLLALVSAHGATVIEIEDLHWADTELIDLLAGPGVMDLGVPLSLLLTARPEVLAAGTALATLGPDEALVLEVLDRVAARRVVAAADSSGRLTADLADAIAERAGGNPLFASELVRLLREHDTITTSELPTTVQAVIAARIDLLGPGARSLGRDAAVVGPVFWPDALAAGGRDGSDITNALEELVAKGIIRRIDPSPLPGHDAYAFRHALMRDVAYGQLTRADRAHVHVSTGRWLRATVPPDRGDLAAAIADHYAAALDLEVAAGSANMGSADAGSANAGLTIHGEAVDALLRAAAFVALDPEASSIRYHRVLGLLGRHDPRRWEAYLGGARAEHLAGRAGGAVTLLDEAVAGLPADADPRLHARLLLDHSQALHHVGREWEPPLRAALVLLDALEPGPEHVQAAVAVAHDEERTGTRSGVIAAASRAITLAGIIGMPPPGSAYLMRGYSRAAAGDAAGLGDLEDAEAAAAIAGDWQEVADTAYRRAAGLLYFGRVADARAVTEAAAERAAGRSVRLLEAMMLTMRAEADFLSGRWTEAIEAADRLEGLGLDRGSAWEASILQLAWLVRDARGEREAADRVLETLGDRTLEAPLWRRYMVEPIRMVTAARAGDVEAVRTASAEVGRQDPGDLEPTVDPLLPQEVRELCRHGFVTLARELAATIDAPSPLAILVADTMRGTLALAEGAPAEAARILDDVATRWDAFGCGPFAADARVDLGDALAQSGRPTEARAALRAARAVFLPLGARRRLDEIDALEGARREPHLPVS